MNEFPPQRQRGLLIHLVLIAVLGAISLTMFWFVFQAPVGLLFTLDILVALLSFIPLPILGYRVYALLRGNYLMDRDNLRLIWGLRVEEIPVADVEWVRPAAALPVPLKLPWLSLPGSVLGRSAHPDLGSIEFMASDLDALLLVATARQVYAISPGDSTAFISAFQRAIEMGSLSRVAPRSQYPSFVVAVAWENVLVRYLWLAGAFLNIGLLAWVTVIAPGIQRIPLGFTPAGAPQDTVPGVQLILLPVLSALLFVIGFLAGLFFYRRPDQHILIRNPQVVRHQLPHARMHPLPHLRRPRRHQHRPIQIYMHQRIGLVQRPLGKTDPKLHRCQRHPPQHPLRPRPAIVLLDFRPPRIIVTARPQLGHQPRQNIIPHNLPIRRH